MTKDNHEAWNHFTIVTNESGRDFRNDAIIIVCKRRGTKQKMKLKKKSLSLDRWQNGVRLFFLLKPLAGLVIRRFSIRNEIVIFVACWTYRA